MTDTFYAMPGVVLVAATVPVTVELAVLTLASLVFKPKQEPETSDSDLHLSVIVPAHNEGLLIARTIRSLSASASGTNTKIVVVAHNCVDETAARAAEAGAEVLIYTDPQAIGKGFALRRGFEHVFSQGADAALVVDADSIVSENLICAVRQAMAHADAAQCRYEVEGPSHSTKGRLGALALRGFNRIRPRGRERLRLSAGILGNGFAIRRSVFLEVPYRALSLVEDLEYHLHLVLAGKRVRFLDEAKVSAEAPPSGAAETTQRVRWEGGRFRVARQWWWQLFRQILRGRLRLLEPLLDLSSLPLAYAAALLSLGLFIPVVWLRIYFLLALAVLGLHVFAAAQAGDEFWADMRLLCMAPAYILWKLRLVPKLFRGSRPQAVWIRTEREAAVRKV